MLFFYFSPTGYLSGYNTPMMTSPQLQFFNRQMSVPGYMPGLQSGPMGNTVEKTDVSIPNPFNPMSGIQRSYRQPMHVPGKLPNNFTSHVVNTPKVSSSRPWNFACTDAKKKKIQPFSATLR